MKNKIGKYEVVGRLGQVGMSSVYKANAPYTGRIETLKTLNPRNDIFMELMGEQVLCEHKEFCQEKPLMKIVVKVLLQK